MSVFYGDVKDFWDYLLFYPEEDEEGYDGVHNGGIKGIRTDAPAEAVKAYERYVQFQKDHGDIKL